MAGQQPGHGEHRANAHFIRFAAGNRHAAKGAQGLQAQARCFPGFHQHAGRSAVGQLRGVAGGDELAGAAHGRQFGQGLVGGAGAVAGVVVNRHFLVRDFLGFLVGDRHGGGYGNDFVLEAAGRLRLGGFALALDREAVLRLAADSIAAGHDVGGLDHRHVQRRFVRVDPGVDAAVDAAAFTAADARDAFHAAGDHGRGAVHDDAAGGHGHRLQARGAKAADRGARDAQGQAGADHAGACDIAPGTPFGVAAAEDGVLDQAGVYAGALDGGLDGERGQGGATDHVELAPVGFGQGGAGGGYDDGFTHSGFS